MALRKRRDPIFEYGIFDKTSFIVREIGSQYYLFKAVDEDGSKGYNVNSHNKSASGVFWLEENVLRRVNSGFWKITNKIDT